MAGVVRDFVAAVLDRGPSIGVRGELTADFLRRLGSRDVEVIGCPSMFFHGPRLDVAKRTALHQLREAKENLDRRSTDGISPERAIEWLRALSGTWRAAEVPAEKADVIHAIYDRIVVAGRKIVSVRLTPSAYAHGLALALPEKVVLARPTGVERADARNIRIPIEGSGSALVA